MGVNWEPNPCLVGGRWGGGPGGVVCLGVVCLFVWVGWRSGVGWRPGWGGDLVPFFGGGVDGGSECRGLLGTSSGC